MSFKRSFEISYESCNTSTVKKSVPIQFNYFNNIKTKTVDFKLDNNNEEEIICEEVNIGECEIKVEDPVGEDQKFIVFEDDNEIEIKHPANQAQTSQGSSSSVKQQKRCPEITFEEPRSDSTKEALPAVAGKISPFIKKALTSISKNGLIVGSCPAPSQSQAASVKVVPQQNADSSQPGVTSKVITRRHKQEFTFIKEEPELVIVDDDSMESKDSDDDDLQIVENQYTQSSQIDSNPKACPQNLSTKNSQPTRTEGNKSQNELLECDLCAKQMKNRRALIYHMQVKHQLDLNHHKQQVDKDLPERNFKCQVCGQAFMKKATLRTHLKIHNKNFKCEICLRKFAHNSDLTEHLTWHKDPASFTCKFCGKRFNQKYTLSMHVKLHEEGLYQRYYCTRIDCNYTTDCLQRIQLHELRHSRREAAVESKKLWIQCEKCYVKVKNKLKLAGHMWKKHKEAV